VAKHDALEVDFVAVKASRFNSFQQRLAPHYFSVLKHIKSF